MINDDLSEKVIGCAMVVHRTLGPGFLETVYRNALVMELEHAGLEVAAEVRTPVAYHGAMVGEFVADVVVEGGLILELKAVQELHPAHEAQLVNYLQATTRDTGLLLNFGATRLGVKRKHRVFKEKANPSPPANPVNPVKKASAFTMLELLVSMAVLSMLIVLLLSMVDNATKMWRLSENRVDAYREARAALNVIARDLASLYGSTDANFFYVDREPTALPEVASQLDGKLFFVTALPVDAQGGATNDISDLCTVGYFSGFDRTSLTGKGNESMNLYRYFRPSGLTFTALKSGDIADGMTIDASATDTFSEVLAKNIIGFKVNAFTRDPSVAGKLVPFTATASSGTPDVIEISLSAISNDSAKRFTDRADWENTNSTTYRENVRTFNKRIVINRNGSVPTPTPSPSPSPTP